MKRIKIAAIGAMLLLGLACSKDKNQIEPTTSSYNSTSNPKGNVMKDEGSTIVGGQQLGNTNTLKGGNTILGSSLRKDYSLPNPTPNPPPAVNDPSTPPTTTAKTATTIVQPPRTIDDSDPNPYQNPY